MSGRGDPRSSIHRELPSGQLLEHQVEGVDWLTRKSRALLADEPGLGKSLQALLSAEEPVLVVAPAMVLEGGVWADEVEKWVPGMDVTTVPYTSMGVRAKNGRVPRDSNGFPLVPLKPEFKKRWGTVICDEAHYIKGRKTWWTSCVQQLEPHAHKLHLLTGTPIPNWAQEAFSLLQVLYPEKAVRGGELGSYWRWAKQWFHIGSHWSQYDVGDLLNPTDAGWAAWREANWGDRYLMRLRSECLDLPPLTIQPFRVKMVPKQKQFYLKFEKDFYAFLDEQGDKPVSAWSHAGQLVKLLQAATGLEVLDPDVKASGKLRALEALLTDRPRPTLVVAHFRSSVEACARTAESLGHKVGVVHGGVAKGERQRVIRGFQSGDLSVMCASIDTVREGLTLHGGGADQCIRVERSWSPHKNEQVIRRLHRIGQDNPVTVIDLITEGTIDEGVLSLLEEKTDHQMRALGVADIRRAARTQSS